MTPRELSAITGLSRQLVYAVEGGRETSLRATLTLGGVLGVPLILLVDPARDVLRRAHV